MMTLLLAAATTLCALQAVRARRLLHAALWLAGVSAFTSVLIYHAGAPQAAVIELSVGAGLVFILFVFAISLAGEVGPSAAAPVPGALALTLLGLVLLLLAALSWPRTAGQAAVSVAPLSTSLWVERPLDVLLQIVLIFAGALTITGLLAGTAATSGSAAAISHLQPESTPLLGTSTPAALSKKSPEANEPAVLEAHV